MSDHRVVMEPGVLDRLGQSMTSIGEAWRRDVEALDAERARADGLERDLNLSRDRAANLEVDLKDARLEISNLLRRNAYYEAQIQRLYEQSMDARDVLNSLAEGTIETARAAPAAESVVRSDGTTGPRVPPMPPGPRQTTQAPILRSSPAAYKWGETSSRTIPTVSEELARGMEDENEKDPPPAFLRTPMPPAVDFGTSQKSAQQ